MNNRDPIPARMVSQGRGKHRNRCMVTTFRGEGSDRISVTRHLVQTHGAWHGNNPDPNAVPANKAAEQVVQTVQDEISHLENRLARAEQAFNASADRFEKYRDGKEMDKETLKGLKSDMLRSKVFVEKVTEKLNGADTELGAAKEAQFKVIREYPLTVPFEVS